MTNDSLAGLPAEIVEMAAVLQRGAGGRFRPLDMLRFLLSDTLRIFSVPQNTRTPAEARGDISRCLALYGAAVRVRPFEDLLGPILLSMAEDVQTLPGARLVFSRQADAERQALASLPEMTAPTPELLRMLEPACGSGVMVLAMMKAISHRDGLSALARWSFTMVDINEVCVLASAAQVLANLHFQAAIVGELVVYQGDSTDIGLVIDPKVVAHLCAEGVHTAGAEDARRLEDVRTAARAQLVVQEPTRLRDLCGKYPVLRKAS